MPALPAVPNVIRLQLLHHFDADLDVLSRLYLKYSGTAPANSDMATFAATATTAWGTNLKALAHSQVVLNEAIATDLSSSSAATGTSSVVTAGTRTGTANAMGTCSMVNLTVGRRYRGGKPRIYFPYGVAGDITTSGLWSSGFVTALNSGYNAFVAALVAAPWSGATIQGQVNVSYYHGFASVQDPVTLRWRNIPTPRPSPLVDTITAVSTHFNVASQRRRNRA